MRNSKCVFKMKNWTLGQPLTNLVTNGDFSNGTTGWVVYHTTVENGRARSFSSAGQDAYFMRNNTLNTINKFYVAFDFDFVSGKMYFMNNADYTCATSGRKSFVFTPASPHLLFDNDNSLNTDYYVDNIVCINLTATFGSGNEPTAAQMDLIAPTWFNGTIKTGSLVPYTKVLDRSRYKNNGTLSGGAVYKLLPTPLYVLDFTNPTSLVTVPKNASINDMAQFTVRGWFYYGGAGGNNFGLIFDKYYQTLGIASAGNHLRFTHDFSTTGGIWDSPTNGLVVAGYYGFQLTYDKTNVANNPVIMIDGVSKTITVNRTPVGTAVLNNSKDLILGNYVSGGYSLNGYLSEIEIYKGILTVAEGKRWYNSTAGKYSKPRIP